MRVALDTNILAYAEDVNSGDLGMAARRLVRQLPLGAGVVGLQVLGELYNVLTRKGKVAPEQARQRVEHWAGMLDTAVTDDDALHAGLELAIWTHLRIWDAIHLSVAAAAGCEVFLSEDLQHGFRWRGVTVINPFRHPDHPLLAQLLESR